MALISSDWTVNRTKKTISYKGKNPLSPESQVTAMELLRYMQDLDMDEKKEDIKKYSRRKLKI